MYIFQRTYKDYDNLKSVNSEPHTLVLILPSTPQAEMVRFAQIVQTCVKKINISAPQKNWEVQILNCRNENRSPNYNYDVIYKADIVIAECSDKKPNVFYLLGLSHAIGRDVCSCYKTVDGGSVDIPFNVHGRQSMTYSLATISQQKEFESKLTEWIKTHG